MKALVLRRYNELVYGEVPQPAPGPGEVLVRVRACGICGSDVHGLDGSTGRRIPPLIMGHEAAGEIAALGPGTAGWQPGERVTFDSTLYCGRCWHCWRGEINLCEHRRVLGVSTPEYRQQGAFAEYVVVPERVLYRLPAELSFEQAALVEPLSVAMHAAARAPVRLGDTALVMGAGVIGLLAVQVLRAAGCGWIVAADLDPGRLALARRLGADAAVNVEQEDLQAQVLDRSGGRGADIAIEAVGVGPAVQAAAASLRKGGSLVLIGNLAERIDLPLQAMVTREIAVYGSCASRGEYSAGLDLLARRAVEVTPLISAAAPLSEGALWFRRLREREAGLAKVLLLP